MCDDTYRVYADFPKEIPLAIIETLINPPDQTGHRSLEHRAYP